MEKTRLAPWPRLLDGVIFILSVLLIVFISLEVYGGALAPARLVVQTEGKSFVYPLSEERIIEVQGPEGITTLEIARGKARFVDSPCPDKTCIAHGWLERSGSWNACLPNMVFASIEGLADEDEEIDFLAY